LRKYLVAHNRTNERVWEMNCINLVMCYQHFVTLALLFRELTKADSAPMEERPRVSISFWFLYLLLVFNLFLCTFIAAPQHEFHVVLCSDIKRCW
jgi:hypothetical protein